MKKIFMITFFLLMLMPVSVFANEKVNIYLFYGEGCPHCKALEEFLNREYSGDNRVTIYDYEVWNNYENGELWEKVVKTTGEEAKGVPYYIIGKEVMQGFSDSEDLENRIRKAVTKAKNRYYKDNVGITLGVVQGKITPEKNQKEENYDPEKKETDLSSYYENENNNEIKTLDVPLIGKINIKDLSVPALAVVMGLVDGFNPCAMWILLFLITMLLDYKNRKKMLILGSTFLFTSAFIYFLFMISFLNLATFINSISILRALIAIFAIIFGIVNIYRFIKTKDTGCDVVPSSKRKTIITKIKEILQNKSFIITLIGIIFLAISVNLLELVCSLGLPVIFTEILALNDITGVKNILYIILYVLFFLLDDLIVFILAVQTLKITAISNKYSKYSHLIGGIIMFLIGLLMFIKPEWLMFNF